MDRIILLEGSDYSGKTSIAKELVKFHGFEYNRGMISNDSIVRSMALDGCSENNIEKATNFFTEALRLDKVAYLSENRNTVGVIIQDKYFPSAIAYGRCFLGENYTLETTDFKNQFLQPNLSIFLYCSYEEKVKRSKDRSVKTKTDEMILSNIEIAGRIEGELIKIVSEMEPTIMIDTSTISAREAVEKIGQNRLFLEAISQK